jgi:tetratricopeptide (TPR) repeat protein
LRALLNDVNTYPLEQENSRLWREYYNARLAYHETRLADAEKVYQAISENEGAEPKLRAYALCDWGSVLSRRERIGQPGGIEKAISTVERSLKLVPLDAHLARGFFYLARVERYRAKWDEEASFLEKAKVFFEQRGDEYGLAYAYVEIKRGSAKRGLWKELFIIQEQLEDLYRRLPESAALKSKVLGGWAWGWALAGRLSESEQKVRDSISLVRSLDDPFFLLSLLRDLGWTLGHQGRYSEADQSLSESLEIARGLEDPYDVGYVLGFLGAILARQGDSGRATEYLLQSLEVKEQLRDEHGILDLLVWLGKGQEIQQDLDKAQEYYRRCSDWKWCGRYYFDSEALCGLVRVKHAQGDYSAIRPLLAEAEALAHQYEYNDHLASLRLTQGHIAWEGHIPEWGSGFDAALHYYQQALTYALRYNRFLLDEALWGGGVATPLRPIIPFCAERGDEGYRMLGALRDWWQSGVNDVGTPRLDTISPIPEGIALLEAERIARKREPGDGSLQEDVVARIERVLGELIAA